jgi:hypothetical protein
VHIACNQQGGASMHDAHVRDATGLEVEVVAPKAPTDAEFLYWNPCLGIPPIVLESPLLFFGIQIAAGLVALLVLLIEPFPRTGQTVGLP